MMKIAFLMIYIMYDSLRVIINVRLGDYMIMVSSYSEQPTEKTAYEQNVLHNQ